MAAASDSGVGASGQAWQRPQQQPFFRQQFNGKQIRKAIKRPTVDITSCIVRAIEGRVWQHHPTAQPTIQPDHDYFPLVMPPHSLPHQPSNAVTTRFFHTSTNKEKLPVFCVKWTPEVHVVQLVAKC